MTKRRLQKLTLEFVLVDGAWEARAFINDKPGGRNDIFDCSAADKTGIVEFLEDFASSVSAFIEADIENGDIWV